MDRRRRLPRAVTLAVAVAVLAAVVLLVIGRPGDHAPPGAVHVLVGAAEPGNGDPSALEAAAGARLGVRRTFWDADELETSVAVARADVAAGRVPLLSYKVGSWRVASEGGRDAWAGSAARQLSALGGTVMVAVHHEPEGDGDIRWWTRMQQRLAPLFDRPHLRYGVILTGYQQFYGPAEYSLAALWPTGAPIRFLGLDIYQSYGATSRSTGLVTRRWTDLDTSYFAQAQRFCRAKGLAWGLAETGLTDEAFAEPAARHWFPDTVAALGRRGGSFLAYFDSPQNSGSNSWPLHGPKLAAFLQVLAGAGPPRSPGSG